MLGCTLRELGKRMDAAELAIWEEDYLERPWDSLIEQMAMQQTLFANVHRDSKKRRQPYSIDDFLPGNKPRPEVPVESKADRAKRLKTLLKALHPPKEKGKA